MNTEINVRLAKQEEIQWINEQYDSVGFKHSVFERELIAIAEVAGVRKGLGRLQNINDLDAELGGIYVNEECRGLGLASKIVDFLVENSASYNKVYCLPFSHLNQFYSKFGFTDADKGDGIPETVINKHKWCNKTYDNETLLFVLNNKK
ncbi:GNAT family N-acetyltransferase [Vibrio sp. Of7-15]|uniref:GNAT family N-acetyltransferase n=1 Tax=Vibrio sp. Of7-15 TaxID=2724879 RepID=UPI001EF2E5B9|nr:GNAT family N-acetyltransferase [Vibrio sp. Of7-15]MCG7495489.1 GNAT family N-acetyltransferase [Vibrio sp. Of7-15]